MTARSVRCKYVTGFVYTSSVMALLWLPSMACAVDAPSPEAAGKLSEPVVAVAGTMIRPEEAVEIPRSVALQRPGPVTVVSHQGIAVERPFNVAAVPGTVKGSAK